MNATKRSMTLLRLGKGIISGLGVGNQERPMKHNYLSQAWKDQWESDI